MLIPVTVASFHGHTEFGNVKLESVFCISHQPAFYRDCRCALSGDSEKLQDEEMAELFSETSSPVKSTTTSIPKSRDLAADTTSDDDSFETGDKDSVAEVPITVKHEIPKPAKLPDIPMVRRYSSASLDRPQPVKTKARPARPSSATLPARIQPGAKRAASGRMDMSKVLTYLKKNRYDDSGNFVCVCVW